MKNKKSILIFSIISSAFIITAFLFMESLMTTSYGKADMNIAVAMKFNTYLHPNIIKGKPVKEIRQILNNDTTKWSAKPIPFSNIKNISIDTSINKIPVRIYTPEGGSKFPIIVYSHGGFWISGNVDSYDNVVEWASKNAESINGDAKHIAVVGDSAGGNLSAVVSQMARDKNGPHTLMIIAEIDSLRDEGKAYAEKLKEASNQVVVSMYKGCPHGFITMDKITSEADKALNEISLYLQKEFQKDQL